VTHGEGAPPDERDRVRDRLIEVARADARLATGAIVGSLAAGGTGDRWSDIDLTFGVADGVDVSEVLDTYGRTMADEFDASTLLDLASRGAIYRVFLLPSCLQVDLSFAPAAELRRASPRFELLWGSAREEPAPPPLATELFGYATMYARAARAAIDRAEPWGAEYYIAQLRSYALALARRRRGLPTGYGRGLDELPADVLARFEGSFVRGLDGGELDRALAHAVECLLEESDEAAGLAERVEPQLRQLASVG
jgi:hypothetical protein